MHFQELSNINSLWRLEYDSPSSPMAVVLFMAVVSLLSASRVVTQFSFGYTVISKHSLDLTLNIINILLGKVSWLTDIAIAIQTFQMREIERSVASSPMIVIAGFLSLRSLNLL